MPCPHSILPSLKRMNNQVLTACSAALLAVILSSPVYSQETSSAVRGIVSDQGGKPIPGSTVVVRNEQTGLPGLSRQTGKASSAFVTCRSVIITLFQSRAAVMRTGERKICRCALARRLTSRSLSQPLIK